MAEQLTPIVILFKNDMVSIENAEQYLCRDGLYRVPEWIYLQTNKDGGVQSPAK